MLTIHHWSNVALGLMELRRVAQERVVIVTWDPASQGFWLVQEYFPEILVMDRQLFPSLNDIEEVVGALRVQPLLVPHNCTDGFLGAYWRRPRGVSVVDGIGLHLA